MSVDTPERGSLDLRETFRVLMRRRALLFAPWAVALLAGLGASFLLKPIYFSKVTLVLERPQSMGGPLSGMIPTTNPEQQAEIMREQVQSSLFLGSVLTASGYKNDPATRQWALEAGKKYTGLGPEERVEAFLIDHLRSAIAIKRGKANIFEITVGDYTAERAKRFAESVANQFVISSKAAQLEAVRATHEFSLEQQQIYKRKLEESEQRLEAIRRSALTSTIQGSSVTSGNVVKARGLLEQSEVELTDQRDRLETLRRQLSGRVQENDAAVLTTPESRSLVAQLNGLERQLAVSQLNDVTGDDGARARQAIARKVQELEERLQQKAALAFPGLPAETRDLLVRYRLADADVQGVEARRAFLQGQLGGYEHEIVSTPDRDLELQRITQEVESNRTLYNSFIQQSVAAQIAEAFENAKVSGRFVVLEPANLPLSPGKPNRPMLVLLAFVVGGVIGVGTVLLVEQHDQSVKNAEEIESLLGLPVLGAVPRVDDLERSRRRTKSLPIGGSNPSGAREGGLLHRLKVESPLGLEFRRIYLKLAKTRGRTLPKMLLVTSSTRGEGKTTISACLGITCSRELREKVLLVDFDLRSPALHRALGLPTSSWGLAQMLHKQEWDERYVRSTVLPHLDFLPAGKSERPAAELIDSDAVEWFIREAASRYPFVLMDSAPSLAVPDSLILGRAVDGVLYVIKAGSTASKAAEYGVKVQREARDNVLGVLMNDAGEVLPHYYGYHDAYGYTPEVAGGES